MTFNAARKKLKKLASGRYRKLYYEVLDRESGESEQECKLYIDGLNHYVGKTWEEAFEKLNQALNPAPIKIEDGNIEEIDVDNQSAL